MKECPFLSELSNCKKVLKISDSTVKDQQKRILKLVGVLCNLVKKSSNVSNEVSTELDPVLEVAEELLDVEDTRTGE